MTSALDRLRARVEALGAPLCLGIDPHPDQLPAGLTHDARGVETFARGLLEAAAEHVAAVKLNAAFYEALGWEGWAVLERVRRDVPPEIVCIVDAKRGDVGPTAERYAEALLGRLGADGVTLSPYLGEDAIEPFLAFPDRIAYVLARTSNPSAGRLQDLAVDGEPLHHRVARWVAATWPGGRVGLVVGATAPDQLASLRDLVPGPPFLIPGVGAQGGDAEAAARHCHGAWGPGLASASRTIASASSGDDWMPAASAAAERLRRSLADAVLHSMTTAARAAPHGGQ
ncbi:MAG: orotidine-5'-phosphate decarboxylase [Candidatus Limnocylindria bacterium]